jgi:hypothetical protein
LKEANVRIAEATARAAEAQASTAAAELELAKITALRVVGSEERKTIVKMLKDVPKGKISVSSHPFKPILVPQN